MKPIDPPEFEEWRLVGEAPLIENAYTFYRKRIREERKDMWVWGSTSVLAISILVGSPWIVRWMGPPSIAILPPTLVFTWFPIYLWWGSRSDLADSVRQAEFGGYWVYEPLTQTALDAFRAQIKAQFADGFEPEGSGKRYVMKEFAAPKGGLAKPRPKLSAETQEKILDLQVPAIAIQYADVSDFSRFGGNPLVPKGYSWPLENEEGLAFVAQIDLSDLPESPLPPSGYLYFFENLGQSGCVLYFEGDCAEFSEASPPSGKAAPHCTYNPQPIWFEPTVVYPSTDRPEVEALGLDNNETEAYVTLRNKAWSDRLLGLPDPVQHDDMEAECHLASGGLSQDPSEWKLLLQLGYDEDWGDDGMLFYWIREEDLANRNFEHVHVISQFT